jgi:hypothetical protein
MTERKPGIRIDGGKRRDLNPDRIVGRMAALPEHAPMPEQAAARRKAMEKRAKAERKAAKIGHEGAMISVVRVRDLQGQRARTLTQAIRCKPGTFEWRYGRNEQDALFHAGNHLAILWERAGMTIASSANFLRGIASGYSTGLADGRAQAIDKLDGFRDAMGQKPAERLIDYCVLGLTTAEIARKDGAKERDMAPVLHQHLRDCARHFRFMGRKR